MHVGSDSMRDIAYMTIDVHHAMTATMAERHMRCWIQRKTWAAAACWQLLIALQLPRNDWCLMGHRTFEDLKNMSEVQLNEKIIPTIADLEVIVVMGSRLKKLVKLRRESAVVSWDPKRKEPVKKQLRSHGTQRLSFELEPTITAEIYLDALWTHILGLAKAGIEEVQDKSSSAESDEAQTYDYVQITLDVIVNFHSRTKRIAASFLKNRALAILREVAEAGMIRWNERVQTPKASMFIHQILMRRANDWGWHDKPGEKQPREPCQPPPSTKFRQQPDLTPKTVGTWATENKKGRILCQAYQQRCGQSKDVKSENVQIEIFNQMRRAQATWIAHDCRTLTKTDALTPGQQHLYGASPPPLCSANDLWGKTRLESNSSSTDWWTNQPLSAAGQSLLLEQIVFIAFVKEALEIIHEANEGQEIRQVGIIENPTESWLWNFAFMEPNQWSLDTSDDEVWTDVNYVSYLWGGVSAKKQKLRKNMPSVQQALHVEGVAGVQCHNHHLQDWEPWKTNLGEWVMPGQAEKEYPTSFVWQIAVATSCETAKRLQFQLRVPRSPALQPVVGNGRPWWTRLSANTVSELMMVPIRLQLMPSPPRNEGHIPPVLQQPPVGAVCCGTRAAQMFQAEAKCLNPLEKDRPAAGVEEFAVMQYVGAWLRMTSTEQLACVNTLVERVLVTGSMPGKINHVHFLAAMVAGHVKEGLVVTSADVAQIPREEAAPRVQAVVGTAARSKRRWLQHDRKSAREWSRPIVELATRPKLEARPQPKAKAKPEVKQRPGALKSTLLATVAISAASLPREMPLMHTQEDFNHFVLKAAPEGSLQGSQFSDIEDLINMESCTLWGKFLLKELEEGAFSGHQVRVCLGQQPGAPSSKGGMQPLLATGIVIKEAASQCGVRLTSASQLPSDKVAFTEDMLSSAAWSAQNETTLRRQRRVFTQILQELCSGMQPPQEELKMEAVPHQHNFTDTNAALAIISMYLIEWPANILPTRIPQGVFEEFQEEIPLATREELRSNNHSQGLTEDFDRPAWTSTLASWSRLPGRRCERVGHADTAATRVDTRSPMVGADASPQHRTGIRQTEAHRRRRESMSNHNGRARRGCRSTLHSNLQHTANWHSL